MPIKLNLLAEAQAQEEMRRNDPVKLALYVGALLVALALVWFSGTWVQLLGTKNDLGQVRAKIAQHTNDFAIVKQHQKKIDDCRKRLESLDKLSEARFLQGQLLDALQQIYVPNVATIRVKLEQNFTLKDGAANKAGVKGPSSTVEKTQLTIDAKDLSPNPGDQINRFKDSVASSDYFKSVLQPNGVRLAGSPSASQTGADGKPFVQFTLECRYPEKNR
jgi:hypothetical protein